MAKVAVEIVGSLWRTRKISVSSGPDQSFQESYQTKHWVLLPYLELSNPFYTAMTDFYAIMDPCNVPESTFLLR